MSHTVNPVVKDRDIAKSGKFKTDTSEPEATNGILIHGVCDDNQIHPVLVKATTREMGVIDEMVFNELKSLNKKIEEVIFLLKAIAE